MCILELWGFRQVIHRERSWSGGIMQCWLCDLMYHDEWKVNLWCISLLLGSCVMLAEEFEWDGWKKANKRKKTLCVHVNLLTLGKCIFYSSVVLFLLQSGVRSQVTNICLHFAEIIHPLELYFRVLVRFWCICVQGLGSDSSDNPLLWLEFYEVVKVLRCYFIEWNTCVKNKIKSLSKEIRLLSVNKRSPSLFVVWKKMSSVVARIGNFSNILTCTVEIPR